MEKNGKGRIIMTNITERFLRYVKVDTMSEEGHDTTPSTMKQFDLARMLTEELKDIGASDVYLDEQRCYVYARIPSNTGTACPKLALVAHMDCSLPGSSIHGIFQARVRNLRLSPIWIPALPSAIRTSGR